MTSGDTHWTFWLAAEKDGDRMAALAGWRLGMLEDDQLAQEGWQDKAELGNQGGGNRAGTRKTDASGNVHHDDVISKS